MSLYLVWSSLAGVAQVTTLEPLTPVQIAERASTIIVATIIEHRVWVDPATHLIRTDLLLSEVTALTAGREPVEHLTFTGGEIGERGMLVHGMPSFSVGTRAVFFVEGDGESEACPTVGWGAGFLPIDAHGHLQRPGGWLGVTNDALSTTPNEASALTVDGLRALLSGRK